jgi:hypothetical protein
MNEDAIRAIVRDTLARKLGGARPPESTQVVAALPFLGHGSHYRYALPESGGPCLIEPAVACNHCGYCQSHGH